MIAIMGILLIYRHSFPLLMTSYALYRCISINTDCLAFHILVFMTFLAIHVAMPVIHYESGLAMIKGGGFPCRGNMA